MFTAETIIQTSTAAETAPAATTTTITTGKTILRNYRKRHIFLEDYLS